VPTIIPAWVKGSALPAALTALATPKSATNACRPGQEHVLRLDVTVHHTVFMRIGECRNHLGQDPDALSDGEFTLARQLCPKRFPIDVWHHVIQDFVATILRNACAGIDEREDIGMVELRGDVNLLQKPLGAERRSHVGPKRLYRNLAAMLQVFGEVDGRHTSMANLALYAISIGEGDRKRREHGGHDASNLRPGGGGVRENRDPLTS
jgi:hypothetical protein